VAPSERPSQVDFKNWRQICSALRLAAEGASLPAAERARVYRDLAQVSLFSRVRPDELIERRGRYIYGQLRGAVRGFRPGTRPVPSGEFDRQALLCWYLRVEEGKPSDREVAEAVGKAGSTYLVQPWGVTAIARQATVRARMWTDPRAMTSATRGAWPGIALLIAEVEQRLGPFSAPIEERSESPLRAPSESAPIETIEAVKEIRQGVRKLTRADQRQDDLRILQWDQKITIDKYGNSSKYIRTRLMGKQQEPVPHIDIPVWYDGSTRQIADYHSGRTRAWRSVAAEWDPLTGGFFKIPLEPPLGNGKPTTLHVRYHTADVYKAGPEWFEWYFAREQSRFDLAITASPEWSTREVKVSCPEETTRDLPQPVTREFGFDWSIEYPEVGRRYRLDWTMTPRP
jgi:hypothetical protein